MDGVEGGQRDRAFLWDDLCVRPGLHEAVDDDAVLRCQSGIDRSEVAEECAGLDGSGGDDVIRADDEDDFLVLVGGDGGIGDEQGLVVAAAGDADAGEETGGEGAVGIREDAEGADRADCGIEAVVDEIDDAVVGEIVFV